MKVSTEIQAIWDCDLPLTTKRRLFALAINKLPWTEDRRKKASQAKIGKPTWSKGKKLGKLSLKRRRQISENLKKLWENVDYREKVIASRLGKRAGEKNPMFGFSQERNPNWKGGVTKVHLAVRNCDRYKAWRWDIFRRDGFKCIKCGWKGFPLEADHSPVLFSEILARFNITNLQEAMRCAKLWDTDNGRTLCKGCHKKFGRRKPHDLYNSE